MNNFKLEPADILVTVNKRKDPLSRIKRWFVGPFDHVLMSMGKVGILVNWSQHRILRFPMLFESYGRGCALRSLSERYGEEVVVLRLKSEFDRRRIPRVLEEAIKLASDERSYYDYYAIARWVLPRIIREKLHLPIPLAWHRDERQICSEAVNEVFIRAGLLLLYLEDVPLPSDFVTESVMLEQVWSGTLSEKLV